MARTYDIYTGGTRTGFDNLPDAVSAVEQHGTGDLHEFIGYEDIYGGTCWKSIAAWVFENGQWFDINIWDGYGDRTPCDRPC